MLLLCNSYAFIEPPLFPCKGEAIYALRLAVSQLRQRDFSLFTFTKEENVTSFLP